MTDRIVLGQLPGGRYGLRVSKPGFNVLSTGDNNILFDSDEEYLQVVESGSRSSPGTINIPNLGFNPFVLASCPRFRIAIEFPSLTQVRFRSLGTRYPTDSDGSVYYAIFNVPVS